MVQLLLASARGAFDSPPGVEMRHFGLNLAASDPLALFEPEEMDAEGNLFHAALSAAWLAATLCIGSIHLFCNSETHVNRMNARAFEDMQHDNAKFLVPSSGAPSPTWANMTAAEQQDAKELALPQRIGEDAKGRCLQDAVVAFSKHL